MPLRVLPRWQSTILVLMPLLRKRRILLDLDLLTTVRRVPLSIIYRQLLISLHGMLVIQGIYLYLKMQISMQLAELHIAFICRHQIPIQEIVLQVLRIILLLIKRILMKLCNIRLIGIIRILDLFQQHQHIKVVTDLILDTYIAIFSVVAWLKLGIITILYQLQGTSAIIAQVVTN